MNAGAFEKEIMPYVHSLDLLDENGTIYTLKNDEIAYSYRTSKINEKSIIISVKLFKQATNFDMNLLNLLDKKRKISQPVNQLSCGCIFKNPSGDYAARLIDSAQLKVLVLVVYIYRTSTQIILLMMVQALTQIS